jgi:hypothetical protein
MVNDRKRLLVCFFAMVLVMALGVWLWRHKAQPATFSVASRFPSTKQTVSEIPAAGLKGKLYSISAELREARDSATQKQRLAELRSALSAGLTNESSAAVVQFLNSKADAPTGQGFKIGGKGFLAEAPTLRTLLLDYLGQLDPAAAAAYARTIFSSMDSPEEWAVALRNLARGDSSAEGRALLEQKTGELLRHEAWQQNPSVAFLEAFDAAVYVGGTNLMPALSDLVRRQDNPAVAHAAFLALDRLVISDAATTLAALEALPDLMQGRELTRANYFARADVRDPLQRQVLEKYLLDPRLSHPEIDAFAGLYPNANFMISANLLTQTPSPDRGALTARDAEALRVLNEWLGDPRFANLRSELEKARERLEGFVQQGKGR